MSGRRVFVFTCEPGGAEVLAPVIELLRGRGWDVRAAAYGHGAARWRRRGLAFEEISPVGQDEPRLGDVDFLITSACSLPDRDPSERRLWLAARRRGVPSLAFLDQWQNYAVRFSGPEPAQRLAFLPDRIGCIDAIGREEMLVAGFPPEILVPLGHPSLSRLAVEASHVDRAAVRARLGLSPSDEALLFVSEPIRAYFGAMRGYDEDGVLRGFLADAARFKPRAKVIVKLHPKDDRAAFARMTSGGLARLIGEELSPTECLVATDAVYGMTSMMLVEGFILGKPVVSIQPGLAGVDPLVLSRRGLIARVDSLAEALKTKSARIASGGLSWTFDEPAFFAALESLRKP